MHEQPPRQEGTEFTEEEKAIILKLREKGIDDAEAREAFSAWSAGEEKSIDRRAREEGGSREDQNKMNIKFELKKGKLLAAAGFFREADEAFMATRRSAHDFGEEGNDLYEEATSLIQDLYDQGYEPPEDESLE